MQRFGFLAGLIPFVAVASCGTAFAACSATSESEAKTGGSTDASIANQDSGESDAASVSDGDKSKIGKDSGADSGTNDSGESSLVLLSDGFDSDPGPFCTGWISGGEVVTATVHSGTQACHYCADANGAGLLHEINGSSVPAGGTYTLDLWVYQVNGGGTIQAAMGFGPGVDTQNVFFPPSSALPAATWTHVVVSAAAPATGDPQQVQVVLVTPDVDCFVMDDVALTRR